MRYLIRNKAVFRLGVLVGETHAKLLSRCRELELKNYSNLSRQQLQTLILQYTDESIIAWSFDPELVAA